MMNNMMPWKEHMKKRALYGCFVTFALPDIAEYTVRLGFDFLLIDNEHGVMEQSTLAANIVVKTGRKFREIRGEEIRSILETE